MGGQPLTTVLIVDDDESKRHAISKILRRGGYEIREVATGAEALRAATERPDLIVLDVKLPDLSGFEVCRRIKSDPATATIPVLHISTTYVDLDDRVQGLEGGADGYLTDVLEPIELLATVKALLRARKAEEAAQISSRQWQFTFDAINDGVILLDRAGKIIQVNQAVEAIFERPWDQFPGMMIQDLLQPLPGDAPIPVATVMATGRRWVVELAHGDRGLRVAMDPIHAPGGGAAIGGLCIVSDVTDRKRMEQELRRRADDLAEADRRKDEFLAMLAHELRNPLAPIRNALEVIRLSRDRPDESEEARAIAERQVVHMARLLDDLLDVSRFTRGHVQIATSPVPLRAVLDRAIEVSRPLIEEGGHELSVAYPAEPVWVAGDETRLAQVVSNLLNNAAKYTERGGHIGLRAARERDEAVIRVQDDGIGLSDEMLPRVFDLFAQDDRSLDRSRGGLGIGLTMVRNLVRLHGGEVDVRSAGLGKGAEFTVRLPVLSPAPTAPPPASHGEARQARPLRVLVVDDSEDSARSLSRVIRHWGHATMLAHDGPSAIESAASGRFDAILLDIGLPGMDGYRVAESLRARTDVVQPLLIALTGYGQEQDLARSHAAGFDHHLVKPVDLERLKGLLGEVRQGRGGEAEYDKSSTKHAKPD